MKKIIDFMSGNEFFNWLLTGISLLITGHLMLFLINVLNK
jgi:hypothetical protein